MEEKVVQRTIQFRGSCACARLTYECTSDVSARRTTACHCVTCRKISGGPFQAFVNVESNTLTFFDQQEHLKYEGLPKKDMGGIVFKRLSKVGERAFCSSCYSSLAMRYDHEPNIVSVTMGTVDESSVGNNGGERGLRLDSHIFVSQKASWIDIDHDGQPQNSRFGGHFEQDMLAALRERGQEEAGGKVG